MKATSFVRDRTTAWLLPGIVLLAIGFCAPLAVVVWTSVRPGKGIDASAYAAVFGSSVFWAILYRTLRAALVVTAMCAVLGYPFAYFVATRARRFAAPIMALVAVPYLTSVLIRSYAWVAILGNHGPVNRLLIALGVIDAPLRLVFSNIGNDIGMLHILLPMLILPLYAAMQRIDPSLTRAAANLGATRAERFFTIFLPLSLPGLAAGSALVFLTALGAYVTPALLGAPGDYLLAQAIQVRIATLADFSGACAQAVVMLVLVVGLLFLCRRVILPSLADDRAATRPDSSPSWRRRLGIGGRRAAPHADRDRDASAEDDHDHDDRGPLPDRHTTPSYRALRALRPAGRGFDIVRGPLLTSYGLLLLFALLAPMVVVVMIAFTRAPYLTFPPPGYSLRWFAALADDPDWLDSLVFSLQVSAAAAFTAVAIGTPYALIVSRRRFAGRRLLWLMAVAPLVLPHIVIGLGVLLVSVTLGLNGTAGGFWIAYSVIAFPFVITILMAAFSRFDIDLERAAANLGARPVVVFLTITLPVLATSFASAFLFSFLSGFDDLIISQFLSSPEHTTLAMRMWQNIQLEISPKTAVVGALQLFVLCACGLFAAVRGYRMRRRARGLAADHPA